ncbi:hypothetical protein PQ610_02105 [Tardisphaera miroshnichenkoae]
MCSRLNNVLQPLSSPDASARWCAWDAVAILVSRDLVPREDVSSLLALLSNPDASISLNAWEFLPNLMVKKLVSSDDLRRYLPSLSSFQTQTLSSGGRPGAFSESA